MRKILLWVLESPLFFVLAILYMVLPWIIAIVLWDQGGLVRVLGVVFGGWWFCSCLAALPYAANDLDYWSRSPQKFFSLYWLLKFLPDKELEAGESVELEAGESVELEAGESVEEEPDLRSGHTADQREGQAKKGLNAKVSGKKHGLWETYSASGEVLEKGTYIMGKKSGRWERYYKNGQLKYWFTWKKGKINGPMARYDRNGQLASTGVAKATSESHLSLHSYKELRDRNGKDLLKSSYPGANWMK
jgi:hypothetical protein